MKKQIATLTIGQAPRVDIIPLLEKFLPAESMAHYGVLDNFTDQEIEDKFSPAPGEKILVSRLKSGKQAKLGSEKIEAGLQQKITMINKEGYKVIMLLCTGEFHHLRSENALLIEPDRVIPPVVSAMIGAKQLGVVVPAEEQIQEQETKWSALQKKPFCSFASPYIASDAEVMQAAKDLEDRGADFLVLDCVGYSEKHLKLMKKVVDIPVILSTRLMAKLVSEFI